MTSLTPYDLVNHANIFRLFLRDKFYPNHVQEVKDNISKYIPTNINSISYDNSNFEYTVLINIKDSENIIDGMYNFHLALMLIELYANSNDLVQLIVNDKSKNKDLLFNIYKHIVTYTYMSKYLIWLYTYHIIYTNDTNKILTLYL